MPQLTLATDDVRQVASADRLCDLVCSAAITNQRPPIISVDSLHGHQVDIGILSGEAFVHITPENGDPPYMITVGESERDGIIDFMLHGHHHTQIAARYLIPLAAALEALRAFWDSGDLSERVEWEEV